MKSQLARVVNKVDHLSLDTSFKWLKWDLKAH